jgi:hypothetical protein
LTTTKHNILTVPYFKTTEAVQNIKNRLIPRLAPAHFTEGQYKFPHTKVERKCEERE